MKVWPKNEAARKVLKHGLVGFPAEGPADWPDDTFTHRRIMDGDVTTEEPKKVQPEMAAHAKLESFSEPKPVKPGVGKV
jgi:hypothetical protein